MRKATAASGSTFNWKLVLFVVVVGGIAYVMTGSSGSPTTTKPAVTAAKTAGTGTDQYLKEDYNARFASLKIEPKDAFMPLVSKASSMKSDPFLISDRLTGGGDWMYTGMVKVDGKPQGLLEEQKTLESDYVSLGQHWKKARIKRITDSNIELVGDDGETAVVKMGDSTAPAKAQAPGLDPAATNPPPALQGAINANSLDVSPLPDAQANQPNPTRRGRGRRGRRNTADNGDQNGS